MELTYSEIGNTFDINLITASSTGHTLPPGIFEVTDNKLMVKSLLSDEAKVNNTIEYVGLRI